MKGAQLSLFGPRMPTPSCLPAPVPAPTLAGKHKDQPHPRLDHSLTGLGYVAWISHGGQVCAERRVHGESDETWRERALAIVQRWDDARVYDAAGVCVWDSRDYPVPSGGAW